MQIKPQSGPQTKFLKSSADIVIYGGAAGGGKSFGLLLNPLYHIDNPEFGCVIFRRNTTQVRNEGGLWDESYKLYKKINGHPREGILEWEFPKGSRVKFSHLEHENTIYNWQGSQIPLIMFDELTHFTEKQFWYMLSRNRSTTGIPGKIRATTNPDPDSFVRRLIDWWIDEDGFAIKERSGLVRWFVRQNDQIIWGDNSEELVERFGKEYIPKSFTFISSSLQDNKILMEKDPGYMSNLLALDRVERGRLLDGNWNIRASAGILFQRQWFPIVEEVPTGWIRACRFWDRAATKPNPENPDPDWTRGLLIFFYPDKRCVVADLRSMRDTPLNVETLIKDTAQYDGKTVKIVSQQDPGSAGVSEANNFVSMLSGYNVKCIIIGKDKVTRSKPVSAQAERRNIMVLRAPWNKAFFDELEAFGEDTKGHDDIVDTLSGGYNDLCDNSIGWNL